MENARVGFSTLSFCRESRCVHRATYIDRLRCRPWILRWSQSPFWSFISDYINLVIHEDTPRPSVASTDSRFYVFGIKVSRFIFIGDRESNFWENFHYWIVKILLIYKRWNFEVVSAPGRRERKSEPWNYFFLFQKLITKWIFCFTFHWLPNLWNNFLW